MNDVQRKSFELLQLFVNICDKWDIPYYLVCGSALGAVKYGGFIPWDDDIDVGLLRPDYERFLEIAPKELPEWCFVQNYRTDKEFPYTFTKLRNSETTFIEEKLSGLKINHGIYMDVFPLDGHPNTRMERKIFALKKKILYRLCSLVLEGPIVCKVLIKDRILRFLGSRHWIPGLLAALEKMYCAYSIEESEKWCNYGNWQGELDYSPQWHYGKGTYATFEGLKVRIPENYDAYFTQKYNEWRNDLPEEDKKLPHKATIVDVNRSYREYPTNSN